MNGWIKLHGKLSSKAFYRHDSKMVHLWIHILISANHEPREEYLGGKPIICQPGQFTTGRKQLVDATGINRSKIERILEKLSSEQQIEQRTTSINRLITVINWQDYQGSEQQNEQRNEQQSNGGITCEQPNTSVLYSESAQYNHKEQQSEQRPSNDRATKNDESEQQIEQRTTSINRLITVINRQDYQGSEQQNEQRKIDKVSNDRFIKEKETEKETEKEEKEKEEKDKEKEKEKEKGASEIFSIRQKISENEILALDFEDEKKENHDPKNEKKETPPPVAPTPSPLKPARKPKPQPEALVFPFSGDEFMEAWRLWMTQPKQRAKPMSAHQLTLKRLAKYPEEFATLLVTEAASSGWQGCIFSQTPAQFRAWEAEKTGGKFNKRMSFTDFQNLPTNGEPKF